MNNNYGIAIHGGAGTILRKKLSAKLENEFRDALKQSIETGFDILQQGGSSLDAVQAAVVFMEDSELFNAGKGAVFTHDETNEMDSSIMCGKTHACGAGTLLRHVKNPIIFARTVMEKSEHILLASDGAEQFAKRHNIELVDAKYFHTKRRWFQLQVVKDKEKETQIERTILDHDGDNSKHGTVGAVALDKDGNLAAATSSGGMTNKRYNRIGDTPMIGAGTYADNTTCAVSTTGHGEYFMRLVTAKDISDLMNYKNMNLKDASEEAIKKLSAIDGSGGVIAIDKDGNIAMPMNTPGMYRASFSNGDKEPLVKIFVKE